MRLRDALVRIIVRPVSEERPEFDFLVNRRLLVRWLVYHFELILEMFRDAFEESFNFLRNKIRSLIRKTKEE